MDTVRLRKRLDIAISRLRVSTAFVLWYKGYFRWLDLGWAAHVVVLSVKDSGAHCCCSQMLDLCYTAVGRNTAIRYRGKTPNHSRLGWPIFPTCVGATPAADYEATLLFCDVNMNSSKTLKSGYLVT